MRPSPRGTVAVGSGRIRRAVADRGARLHLLLGVAPAAPWALIAQS
jgi:hypothetical protein